MDSCAREYQTRKATSTNRKGTRQQVLFAMDTKRVRFTAFTPSDNYSRSKWNHVRINAMLLVLRFMPGARSTTPSHSGVRKWATPVIKTFSLRMNFTAPLE